MEKIKLETSGTRFIAEKITNITNETSIKQNILFRPTLRYCNPNHPPKIANNSNIIIKENVFFKAEDMIETTADICLLDYKAFLEN